MKKIFFILISTIIFSIECAYKQKIHLQGNLQISKCILLCFSGHIYSTNIPKMSALNILYFHAILIENISVYTMKKQIAQICS